MGLEKKGRWSRTPENQSSNASVSGIERQVDSEHYFHYFPFLSSKTFNSVRHLIIHIHIHKYV